MWLRAERLSETSVTFAGAGRASDETGVAFACSCACGVETAIAFAGAKWAFWVRFSAAEVPLVASSPRHSCLCAKKFALLGPMVGASAKKFALRGLVVGVSAKKFALRAQNGPK